MSNTSELHKKYKKEEKQAKLEAKIQKFVQSELNKISQMSELEKDIYGSKLQRKQELLKAKIADLEAKQKKYKKSYIKDLSKDAVEAIAGSMAFLTLVATSGALFAGLSNEEMSTIGLQFASGALSGVFSFFCGCAGGIGGFALATCRPVHKGITNIKINTTNSQLKNNSNKLEKFNTLKQKLDGLGIER